MAKENTYKNIKTGLTTTMPEATFKRLLPVYDSSSNSLLPNGGFVLVPGKPKNKKAKEILKDSIEE